MWVKTPGAAIFRASGRRPGYAASGAHVRRPAHIHAIAAVSRAASAKAFLQALHKACPIRISKILTDNGKEFSNGLLACNGAAGKPHEFDALCAQLGIEHRLTRPRTPRTNGMAERFNGRIADILKIHRFNSAQDLQQTLLR